MRLWGHSSVPPGTTRHYSYSLVGGFEVCVAWGFMAVTDWRCNTLTRLEQRWCNMVHGACTKNSVLGGCHNELGGTVVTRTWSGAALSLLGRVATEEQSHQVAR